MYIAYLIAVILAALALTRVPSAVTGRNLPVMLSAAAIVIAFALITPTVYASIDQLLAVPNLVDLIAKLMLFTGLILAGTQVARAYNAPQTQKLISGLPGATVFFGVFLVEVVIFAIIRTTDVAPDLAGNLDNPLVRVYSTVATAYPAYLAVLIVPLVRQRLTSTERSTRATSILLLVGFALAGLRFLLGLVTLFVPPTYYLGQVVSGVVAIAVAAGLATAFFARVSRQQRARRSFQ